MQLLEAMFMEFNSAFAASLASVFVTGFAALLCCKLLLVVIHADGVTNSVFSG